MPLETTRGVADAPGPRTVRSALSDDWTWFRMSGTAAQLQDALQRLAEAGWTVMGTTPVQGPLESWTVAVRPPAPSTPTAPRLAAS